MKLLISSILFALIGMSLGLGGIGITDWQFWVIFACVVGVKGVEVFAKIWEEE